MSKPEFCVNPNTSGTGDGGIEFRERTVIPNIGRTTVVAYAGTESIADAAQLRQPVNEFMRDLPA